MQIFALEENTLIPAASAEKRKNYICPECKAPLRLKSGPKTAPHFYHSHETNCERAQKGVIHLHLQLYLQTLLGPDTILEKPFPQINRIADVFHNRTVYEIQYSPMTLAEAKARTRDYTSLGLNLVWILHDHTFNKTSPTEQYLRTQTTYFTNMDKEGDGLIYDRLTPYGKRPVNLRIQKPLPDRTWPKSLQPRSQTWRHYHQGDYFDLALQNKLQEDTKKPPLRHRLKEGYLALLHHLLKRE
ncbi:MAG: competence protein CoiA family protein [Simkaniaceae bacterium]|nr:competence protein CoiA family protein [Candidatus Sacchlamyda saccharinae]